MSDIEKVIKVLESLHDRLLDDAKQDALATLDASMVADAITMLEEQSEIIQCKDCRHPSSPANGVPFCKHIRRFVDANWFCADGERKSE